ncbi:uncharacterized protein LOC143146888 isoform X2 [Ptiloglossa arizonensis]|uniref:uncharacterized protein LOC143146888 isoform X2 n=1 Tax=Ptiloglossa arizonensis TaxID=3350558 RepID=UPI003FA149EB
MLVDKSSAKISGNLNSVKAPGNSNSGKILNDKSSAKISGNLNSVKAPGNSNSGKILNDKSSAKISGNLNSVKAPGNPSLAKATKADEKNTKGKQPNVEVPSTRPVSPGQAIYFPRPIRPETRTLQYILSKQSNAPSSAAGQNADEPAYLKKFNIRDQHKFMKIPNLENAKQTLPTEKGTLGFPAHEKKLEEEDRDKGARKWFQDRLRDSFLGRTFNRFVCRVDCPAQLQKGLAEKSIDEKRPDDPGKIENLEAEKTKQEEKVEFKSTKVDDVPEPAVPEPAVPEISLPVEEVVSSPKVDDVIATSPDSTIKEETNGDETTAVVPEEEENKTELLAGIIARQSSGLKVTKRAKSQELSNRSVTLVDFTEKDEIQVSRKQSEVEQVLRDREKEESESRVCVTRHQESMKEISTEQPEKDTVTVCMQCVQRKLSSKWSRQPPALQSRESETRTICISSKFPNESFNFDNERLEESRYNCCCSMTSQYSDRHTDYPKSCLKKERQFYRIGVRDTNSTLYHENRNWEECNCRRVLPCDNCRGSRNECSCRPTISCTNCRKPRNECECSAVCNARNTCRCMKSMFCLYCDNPREKCVCRAPLRKCSCCELSVDLCMCEDRKSYGDGRPVLTEPDNERTMYVTAWKPREEVRRYFSRNFENRRTDSVNECRCHEKVKSRNSDDLPYQRLPVFSDVMDELQQKISESTCCTQCRKSPCCCGIKAERDEVREERKMKYRVSPKTRRKIVCRDKPRSKSPNVCNCDAAAAGQTKIDKPKKIVVPVCCACKSSPCRCRKTKSSPKKPRAKCYYCKNSPCVCITSRERGKPRPCRCADSPCRTKEKEIVPCGKTSTKPKNNEEKLICVR